MTTESFIIIPESLGTRLAPALGAGRGPTSDSPRTIGTLCSSLGNTSAELGHSQNSPVTVCQSCLRASGTLKQRIDERRGRSSSQEDHEPDEQQQADDRRHPPFLAVV